MLRKRENKDRYMLESKGDICLVNKWRISIDKATGVESKWVHKEKEFPEVLLSPCNQDE